MANKKDDDYAETLDKAQKEREHWDMDRLVREKQTWKDVEGSGRTLTNEQKARKDATDQELKNRINTGGNPHGSPSPSSRGK